MENYSIKEVSKRLKSLREMSGVSVEDMAAETGVDAATYAKYENGESDFSFNFVFNAAKRLSVDLVELITGESAKLRGFELTRGGQGMPIVRRSGFNYLHLAHNMRDRIAEPFVVTVPYNEFDDTAEIKLSRHEGQEFDYILSGALKVKIDEHEMILNEGDSIYYDSAHGHGMVATGGKECKFIAVVMKADNVK